MRRPPSISPRTSRGAEDGVDQQRLPTRRRDRAALPAFACGQADQRDRRFVFDQNAGGDPGSAGRPMRYWCWVAAGCQMAAFFDGRRRCERIISGYDMPPSAQAAERPLGSSTLHHAVCAGERNARSRLDCVVATPEQGDACSPDRLSMGDAIQGSSCEGGGVAVVLRHAEGARDPLQARSIL